jgi:flagellar assembly protein FliH
MTRSLEREILELVVEISRKILHMEMDMDDALYLSMARHALARLQSGGKITVRVSPSEYGRFFSGGSAEFTINRENIRVQVEEDHSLMKNDLIIESEGESIDAGLETQLDSVEDALLRENINMESAPPPQA